MNKTIFRFKNKIGQSEIIGVIVIVVIVILVMLIYLVYKIGKPAENIKRDYINKELAVNYLVSATKVTIEECPQHTLTDLIIDCSSSYKTTYCSGQESCYAANKTLVITLSRAFSEIGKNFSFFVVGTPLQYENGCSEKEKIEATQEFTILPHNQKAILILDVCDT